MDKNEIHLSDINRILFGTAPASFLLETLLRTVVVFLFLLAVTRGLGKRMKGQLSITEMAIMLMIGAVASVAMQVPDRGILQGILLLALILLLQRGITWLEVKSRQVEKATQGTVILLVKDGLLQLREMQQAPITRQEIFAMLRAKNIPHLGRVDRAYFEACGLISVFRNKENDRPGLSVWPDSDDELMREENPAPDALQACTNCGWTQQVIPDQPCDNCRHTSWTKAVI